MLPRDLVVGVDGAARRSRPAALAIAPLRTWLRRGSARVLAGAAQDLRLSLAHLPAAQAQAGMLVRGQVELPVQEAFRRLIAPGATVYDVGANVGFFTMLAARLAGPDGRVVAFEPVPACAEAVVANAELNGFANVTVLQRAAGTSAHRERLLVVADRSWSHLESRGRHPLTTDEVEVEVVAIDDLVASGELPPPDVVKIDIEGSEMDALMGMRRTIADHRPAIVCELHETAAEVAALCEELGLRATSLDGPEPLREAGPNANVLLEPE
jgi:FkbM family methyltransferase